MSITLADVGGFGSLPFTSAGGSKALAAGCAPGDLIVAALYLLNVTTNTTPTLSDNINSGNYTAIGSPYYDSTHDIWSQAYYKVANASGTPTISVGSLAALGASVGGDITGMRWSGFAGIATLSAGEVGSTAVSTGTAIASTSVNTSHSPELMMALITYQSTTTISGTNWSGTAFGSGFFPAYNLVTTAIGTAEQVTTTAAASTVWGVTTFGFYDKVGAVLAAGATDTTAATGQITAAIKMASAAVTTVTAAASLLTYAQTTLVAPVYTGVGSIADPNFWQRCGSNVPVAGDTMFYDPTFITIKPNGEVVSTSNNCSAVVQFNDGTGWALGTVVIVPTMVGYVVDPNTAAGALTAAVNLAAAATSLTSGTGALVTAIKAAGAASDVVSATAALTAAIRLAGAAMDTSSGLAQINAGGAGLAASPTDVTSAAATLQSQIRIASAASDLTQALAALTTNFQLQGAGLDTVAATGKIFGAPAVLMGAAADSTSALAALTTHLLLASAARDLVTGGAAMSTQIQLLGAALSITTGIADLTTNESPAGVYAIDPAYVIVGHRDYATQRLPSMAPTEERVVTFNFADDLENGETLMGIIVVSVVCSAGVDNTPGDLLNGFVSFSKDKTQVCQPVIGTTSNNDYYITVTALTTNPKKVLSRFGILPIRA